MEKESGKRNEAWFESRWWVVSGGGRLLQSSAYTSPEQPDLVGDGGKRVRLGKLNEETEKIGESAGKKATKHLKKVETSKKPKYPWADSSEKKEAKERKR